MMKKPDFSLLLYPIRERAEDYLNGRRSLSGQKHSPYAAQGAYKTQSTDYRWLDRVFSSYPVKEGAVIVDVGCGEGRVLSYLRRRSKAGRIIGVELDEEVAAIAGERMAGSDNVQVLAGDVLQMPHVIKEATAFYLFNPFNRRVLLSFLQLVESRCRHNVILYYVNDLHRDVLDKRENWTILRRDILVYPGGDDRSFTVYRYKAAKARKVKVNKK